MSKNKTTRLPESPSVAAMRYFGSPITMENYLQFAYLNEVDTDDAEVEDTILTPGDVQ